MKRTIGKSIIGILLLSLTISLFAGMMSVGAANDPILDAKNSVVAVLDSTLNAIGSGFAIGKKGQDVQYFVTNNHVVNPNGEDNVIAYIMYSTAKNDYEEAEIILHDDVRDLAVLRISTPTNRRKPLVLCKSKYVDMSKECAALGFPYDQVSAWQRYDMDSITITRGYISREDRVNNCKVYRLDIELKNGNSGGPIVNTRGEVVAIAAFKFYAANNEVPAFDVSSYAIMADELIRLLEPYAEDIPFTQHSSVNVILIIIAAVLLSAVIALVVILIVVKSKKAPAANSLEKQQPAAPQGQVPPQQQMQRPGAKVVALGGVMNGKKYSVRGIVKIGRDASQCGIAFPVNAQGVGRVHCEVGFDGAVCYVRDLSSSFGTFMADGTRLAPNQPKVLMSGDKFYLASPENMFEVQL